MNIPRKPIGPDCSRLYSTGHSKKRAGIHEADICIAQLSYIPGNLSNLFQTPYNYPSIEKQTFAETYLALSYLERVLLALLTIPPFVFHDYFCI